MINYIRKKYDARIKDTDLSYHKIKSIIPEDERNAFIIYATILSRTNMKFYSEKLKSKKGIFEKLESADKDILHFIKKNIIQPYLSTSKSFDKETNTIKKNLIRDHDSIFELMTIQLINEYIDLVFDVGAEMTLHIEYTDEIGRCVDPKFVAKMTL